jgi:hypothetical protein
MWTLKSRQSLKGIEKAGVARDFEVWMLRKRTYLESFAVHALARPHAAGCPTVESPCCATYLFLLSRRPRRLGVLIAARGPYRKRS